MDKAKLKIKALATSATLEGLQALVNEYFYSGSLYKLATIKGENVIRCRGTAEILENYSWNYEFRSKRFRFFVKEKC